jgi:hypothetical protein
MIIFSYEIFWGCGSTEYGLVKASSIEEAREKVATRSGGKYYDVYSLSDLDFTSDFYVIYEN